MTWNENKMKVSDRLINNFEKSEYSDKAARSARYLKSVFTDALQPGDKPLTIISDSGHPENQIAPMLSYAYHTAAKNMGFESNLVWQTPRNRVREVSADVLSVLKGLSDKSTMMVSASRRIGTLDGLGKSFRSFSKNYGHRFTSASNLGNVPMEHFNTLISAHRIDYKSMARQQQKLKKKLDATSEITIITKAGTNIRLGVSGSQAVFNHGIYDSPGMGGNLPAGEIYTPINKRDADGTLVIDASSRQKDQTVLCEEPIEVTFEGGVATQIKGGKEALGLKKTYAWAEKRAKFPWGIRMLSELGIGLNERAKIVGATILDEKVKGTAHIATGSNHWFGGNIKAIVHLDQVFKKPLIKLDGKRLNI